MGGEQANRHASLSDLTFLKMPFEKTCKKTLRQGQKWAVFLSVATKSGPHLSVRPTREQFLTVVELVVQRIALVLDRSCSYRRGSSKKQKHDDIEHATKTSTR